MAKRLRGSAPDRALTNTAARSLASLRPLARSALFRSRSAANSCELCRHWLQRPARRTTHVRLQCAVVGYTRSSAMQHLLDFIHEHTLEQQLYLVVPAPEGELELTWQRAAVEDNVWQVRRRNSEETPARVHCGDLLDHLEALGADMGALGRELHSLVVIQIAFADAVLRDATQLLGYEAVQQAAAGYRSFALQLKAAVDRVTGPARHFQLVPGGAAESSAGTGNLTLVR